jgi:hypothetical protein
MRIRVIVRKAEEGGSVERMVASIIEFGFAVPGSHVPRAR